MANKGALKKHLPVRSSSHIKEDKSRLLFESVIPWMVISWISKDYGIDAIVEITQRVSHAEDEFVTGKRFSVQLKSTTSKDFSDGSVSVSVKKEKIIYWHNSIEPVLFAIIDLPNSKIFFRWVDEQLISELFLNNEHWIGQEIVTIKVNLANKICSSTLAELEEYVVKWRRPQNAILTPGTYFHYSNNTKTFVDTLLSNVSKFKIPFLRQELNDLNKQVQQAIYTIAIVGPSRSGKSTLINALLRKKISPIGSLPTTGIPITIFPRNENSSLVFFQDGSKKYGPADADFIKQYGDQKENPDNYKKVRFISVSIVNDLLEKGFALCDIPGLDDPDDDIRAISKTAIFSANAIVYVINAGTMADGGFSITKSIIDDLKELSGKMDKVFIVLNKMDKLTEQEKKELQDYIKSQFDKFNITRYLPCEPIFISSKLALEIRLGSKVSSDPLIELEEQVWKFLLAENKTGLRKLLNNYADCKELLSRYKKIINAKLLNDETKRKLVTEIEVIQLEISQLNFLITKRREKVFSDQNSLITTHFDGILKFLKNDLESLSINQPLPEMKTISTWVENNAFRTLSTLYYNLEENIRELQYDINRWIAQKLKQVEIRLEIESINKEQQMPDIESYTGQINSFLNPAYELHPGILEKVLISVGIVVELIIETITNLVTSNENLRKRDINKIIKNAANGYEKIKKEFLENLDLYLTSLCKEIEKRSADRTNVYLGELTLQLKNLEPELDYTESLKFGEFLSSIQPIEEAVASDFIHLDEYNNGLIKFQEQTIKD